MKFLTCAAEEIGVKIGIEGVHCFVINTPQKMKRLIDDLNSENICVIFDPVNYLNISNYKDQDRIFDDYFDLLGNKTGVLHLKDFSVQNNDLNYEYPCEGLLNADLIFTKLKKTNPEIPIILEEVKENKLLNVIENIKKYI